MNNNLRSSVSAAAASMVLLTLGVAGCSDGAEEQDVIEGPETSAVDGGEQVVAPVIVDSAGPVTLKVGQVIDVTTDGVTEVETSDPTVLEVSQPSDDGSAQFNAGATAVSAGEATITVRGDGEVLYEVEVTVEEA